MQAYAVYAVGGAVRDELMGRESKDNDWVVVGATPEQMYAKGFRKVGADNSFPVFLDPNSNEEYALARTERKTGQGHQAFLCDTENVTLEEDLSRRDLTINAIAKDEHGNYIDPFGGRNDIHACVLRHVSDAFSEDPLRVLRVARFLARFGPQWTVAPETYALLEKMVASGELDTLTPERVWKEVSRGLMEPWPLMMIRLMQRLGIFARPGMADYAGVLYGFTSGVQAAAQADEPLEVRFALAFPRAWTREQALASRIPASVREVTELAQTMRGCRLHDFAHLPAETRMQIVERLDPVRQTERCELVLRTLAYTELEGINPLRQAVERVRTVDVKAITQSMPAGPAVGQAIRAARLAAVAA